jgi:hypothetical protein
MAMQRERERERERERVPGGGGILRGGAALCLFVVTLCVFTRHDKVSCFINALGVFGWRKD